MLKAIPLRQHSHHSISSMEWLLRFLRFPFLTLNISDLTLARFIQMVLPLILLKYAHLCTLFLCRNGSTSQEILSFWGDRKITNEVLVTGVITVTLGSNCQPLILCGDHFLCQTNPVWWPLPLSITVLSPPRLSHYWQLCGCEGGGPRQPGVGETTAAAESTLSTRRELVFIWVWGR